MIIVSIVSFIYVIISMIFLFPFGIIAIFFYFLGLRRAMRQAVCWIEKIWGMAAINISRCNVTVSGRENIPQKGGVCFVSNHDSLLDIALLLAYCRRPIGFIAKKELAFIPILNCWIFMTGGLFIDRKSLKKAINTINKGAKKIKKGSCIIIFPEGHRSKGQGLLPFHAGSLKLATMAEAPIVPIAIKGSYDVFEKNKQVVPGCSVHISFCEPINTASLPSQDRKAVLCDKIYTVIKEKLDLPALTEG